MLEASLHVLLAAPEHHLGHPEIQSSVVGVGVEARVSGLNLGWRSSNLGVTVC